MIANDRSLRSHRADIDGMRAMAILFVVIYHAAPNWIRGGFVGVDIFFVISGYLISSIIFQNHLDGTIDFTDFYARRARRIFPALLVVFVFVYAFGWAVLFPSELKHLSKSMAAGAAFVINFLLMKESGYFDSAATFRPLLHLWSLAIEEQFYLVFPILIWMTYRWGLNTKTVVSLCLFASFAMNMATIDSNQTVTFFSPQARVWELLIGASVAAYQILPTASLQQWRSWIFQAKQNQRIEPSISSRPANSMSVFGFALAFGSAFFIQSGESFPGWLALMPTLGTALLILAGPQSIVNHTLLSNRLVVWIGSISYPLYLWHWPLLSIAEMVHSSIDHSVITAAAVLSSFLLAHITYQLVEKNVRFKQHWGWTGACCAGMVLIFAVSCYTFNRDGFETNESRTTLTEKQLFVERDKFFENTSVNSFASNRVNIAIVGDSQAQDIFNALRSDEKLGLFRFDIPYPCTSLSGTDIENRKKPCKVNFNTFIDSKEIRQADIVLFVHMWQGPSEDHENEDLYREGIKQIRAANPKAKIYLFGQKPVLGQLRSDVSKRTSIGFFGINDYIQASLQPDKTSTLANKIALDNALTPVDVHGIFCQSKCVFYDSGIYSYIDFNHWTSDGAKIFYSNFIKTDIYSSMLAAKH